MLSLAITIDQSARLAQVDPEAQFLPAHITGTLHSEKFRLIALALNGTVRDRHAALVFCSQRKKRHGGQRLLIHSFCSRVKIRLKPLE